MSPVMTASINSIAEYYEANREKIIEFHKKRLDIFYDAYPFDWVRMFTPIEMDAWSIIRSIGRIPLYPQFPVLSYRLDFGNPFLKIGLECDGKEYHNKERDKVRDERLLNAGWKIFRVTGSELYRNFEFECEEDGTYTYDSLKDFYLNTAEGVIAAIREFYFHPTPKYLPDEEDLQLQTLISHKLADFKIKRITKGIEWVYEE